MGWFEWLSGHRPAPRGATPQSQKRLRAGLMGVNRDGAPFIVRGGKAEGVDLVAEWKILDAEWYEIFAEAGLKRVFKVLMKFDAAKSEVRAVDRACRVEWRAGVPSLSLEAQGFRGRTWEKSFEKSWAFRKDGSYGKVYDHSFDTSEIKAPLIEAAHAAGWGWRPVSFGKL